MKIATPNKYHIYDAVSIRCEEGSIIIDMIGKTDFRIWDYDKAVIVGNLGKGFIETIEIEENIVAKKAVQLAVDYFINNPNGVFLMLEEKDIAKTIAEGIKINERK